jgi:hypothetical protein
VKRLLFLAAVLLPNCTGCVAFAYPTLAHVPELTVPNPDGSVHAFRVDVDTTVGANTKTQYTLSRIPIDARGLIPSQLELAPATGVYNPFGITGVAEERSNYTMLVRVYRPGYRTIEVQAWDKSRELMWLPAADLAAQEKAIDDLLAVPGWSKVWSEMTNQAMNSGGMGYTMYPPAPLQPGSVSSMHRQALQFAASEFGRLANSPAANAPTMQPVRERLQQKAIWLRRYADETPRQP